MDTDEQRLIYLTPDRAEEDRLNGLCLRRLCAGLCGFFKEWVADFRSHRYDEAGNNVPQKILL